MKSSIPNLASRFLLSLFPGAPGVAAAFNVRDCGAKADKATNDQAAPVAPDAAVPAGAWKIQATN